MIKKIAVILMLSAILITFYSSIRDTYNAVDSYSKDYFVSNTLYETGSQNIVTGIYLDYRLFDSIFEAGILLITVTGIIFMSKKDDEVL
jgi:multicomponent Na+:H+ antiporter subunit B